MHHTYCNFSFLTELKQINPIEITLPKGNTVIVNQVGSVVLIELLTLHHVLFVPTFKFNLLSVSMITSSHHCFINFLSNSCVIQNLTQDLMIGKGRRQGNLYFLDFGISCNKSFISSSIVSRQNLWHARLGHPSNMKTQFLNKEPHVILDSDLQSHCKVCHLAKQKRLLFISQNNMSKHPFDLIHIDI